MQTKTPPHFGEMENGLGRNSTAEQQRAGGQSGVRKRIATERERRTALKARVMMMLMSGSARLVSHDI